MLQSFLCKLSKCVYNLKNVKLVCDLMTFLVTGRSEAASVQAPLSL